MSSHAILLALHALSAVVWVGGMFFAYLVLRPSAASLLQPPERLQLWSAVFGRFFPWVWASVILLPLTGYAIIFSVLGGMGGAPLYVHVMNGLGILMILIYLHVFFAPFRRLRKAVAAQDWPRGAASLNQIRMLVGINLLIGLVVIVTATAGRVL